VLGAQRLWQLGDNSLTNRSKPITLRSGQLISFIPPATAGSGAVLTLTASGGLTPITFDTWTATTCSVSGTTLTLTGVSGSLCGVRASQPGAAPLPAGGSVAPAPQQLRLIRIAKVVSSTSISSGPNPSTFGNSVTLTAQVTGSTSPLPGGTIIFSEGASTLGSFAVNSSGAAVYTSSALTVSNHNVTASYSGDARNTASTGVLTQVVNPASQLIVFAVAPSVSVGGSGTVSATGGASGNAVTCTSNTPSICTVSGAVVTGVATGSCVIAANQLGNGNYNAAVQQTQSFSISAALPILDIDASAPTTSYDAASDGVLLIRYLLGYRDSALTLGAISPSAQRNATQIAAHIAANLARFDVDGDGLTLATTDGVMILRRLLGVPSPAAITQGVKNSIRSDAAVLSAIDALKP